MNNIWILAGSVITCILYTAFRCVRGRSRKRAVYEFKLLANALRPLVHLVVMIYFMVWGLYRIPDVINWSLAQIAKYPEYGSHTITYWTYAGAPFVALFALLSASVWFVAISVHSWVKYNDQEKEWLRERREKVRARLVRIFGERVGNFLAK